VITILHFGQLVEGLVFPVGWCKVEAPFHPL